jgi:hypothetical protein
MACRVVLTHRTTSKKLTIPANVRLFKRVRSANLGAADHAAANTFPVSSLRQHRRRKCGTISSQAGDWLPDLLRKTHRGIAGDRLAMAEPLEILYWVKLLLWVWLPVELFFG